MWIVLSNIGYYEWLGVQDMNLEYESTHNRTEYIIKGWPGEHCASSSAGSSGLLYEDPSESPEEDP